VEQEVEITISVDVDRSRGPSDGARDRGRRRVVRNAVLTDVHQTVTTGLGPEAVGATAVTADAVSVVAYLAHVPLAVAARGGGTCVETTVEPAVVRASRVEPDIY
jgi:hypothetical protein